MIFAILFAFWRIMEILTLIIVVGMLSWFVDGYVKGNLLTPNFILLMFIVSVLGLAWAILTLFSYHRSSTNARFVGVIDLAFFGAFIAAVYYLSFIGRADCTSISIDDYYSFGLGNFLLVQGQGLRVTTDKPCAMLKASYAFGIMNCIFFFTTAVLALIHGRHMSREADKYRRSSRSSHHSSRHGHRRSGSHGSYHSRRSSHHSHHRSYV